MFSAERKCIPQVFTSLPPDSRTRIQLDFSNSFLSETVTKPFLPRLFLSCLENARHKSPWNLPTVLFPNFSILGRATLLIAITPVYKDRSHEDGICPWQYVLNATRSAHRVRENQIANVIHVTRKLPPA